LFFQSARNLPASEAWVLDHRRGRKEADVKHGVKNERGMALALAIVALVVVGALIAGAFFSGTQEQRAGENVRRALASFGVAEEGAYDIIRGWDKNRVTYAGCTRTPRNGRPGTRS